jgi:AhpD family alkylhydroperoxidase
VRRRSDVLRHLIALRDRVTGSTPSYRHWPRIQRVATIKVKPSEEDQAMASARQVRHDLAEPARHLHEDIPEVLDAYTAMEEAVMTDGALPAKVKELIALAIGAAKECDGCIAAHARGAARQKAAEAEVAEAMGVVVLMNGGPGTVWAPRALAAYREFAGR